MAAEFSAKLAAMARQAADGKPISLDLQLEPVSLDSMPETEFQLLRIAQEAISNALAHATAQTVNVRLQMDQATLRLTIEDDGIGFEAGAAGAIGHYGLLGMQERADEIGAKLSIASSRQSGACVTVELALSRSEISASNVDTRFEHQTK